MSLSITHKEGVIAAPGECSQCDTGARIRLEAENTDLKARLAASQNALEFVHREMDHQHRLAFENRADSARLDWLSSKAAERPELFVNVAGTTTFYLKEAVSDESFTQGSGATVREAMDSAMQKEPDIE